MSSKVVDVFILFKKNKVFRKIVSGFLKRYVLVGDFINSVAESKIVYKKIIGGSFEF